MVSVQIEEMYKRDIPPTVIVPTVFDVGQLAIQGVKARIATRWSGTVPGKLSVAVVYVPLLTQLTCS